MANNNIITRLAYRQSLHLSALFNKYHLFILQELQDEVLSYRSTWAVMWLWKVSSADAFLQFTMLAILFDKLWVNILNVVLKHIFT